VVMNPGVCSFWFDLSGLFASKSNRRTAAPTFERIPTKGTRFNVGAGLLAKNDDAVYL
jgi:hypothetical protein